MSVKVLKSGILDSVQDIGRYGFQYLGINPGGAMDRFSMRVANMLVGNDAGEAVIEMHFPASTFLFTKPAVIAISGANFSASINGEPVPMHRTLAVNKNSVLQFHNILNGARTYLAVKGGFEILPWKNSCSTHLKAKAGGYNGRALQKDDEINFRDPPDISVLLNEKDFIIFPWQADEHWDDGPGKIFILPGMEWGLLDEESKKSFLSDPYTISNQSDRMGYRLDESLASTRFDELVSSAVNFGTIQLLPDGRMIILMADHQTTGGYPRLAHVIAAHHSKLGQMKAGDKISFQLTDHTIAEELLIKQQMHLLQIQNACILKLFPLFKS